MGRNQISEWWQSNCNVIILCIKPFALVSVHVRPVVLKCSLFSGPSRVCLVRKCYQKGLRNTCTYQTGGTGNVLRTTDIGQGMCVHIRDRCKTFILIFSYSSLWCYREQKGFVGTPSLPHWVWGSFPWVAMLNVSPFDLFRTQLIVTSLYYLYICSFVCAEFITIIACGRK